MASTKRSQRVESAMPPRQRHRKLALPALCAVGLMAMSVPLQGVNRKVHCYRRADDMIVLRWGNGTAIMAPGRAGHLSSAIRIAADISGISLSEGPFRIGSAGPRVFLGEVSRDGEWLWTSKLDRERALECAKALDMQCSGGRILPTPHPRLTQN